MNNLTLVVNFMATLLFLGENIEGEIITNELVIALKKTGSRNFDFQGLKSYLWTKGFGIKKGKIVKDSRRRVVAVCLPDYSSDDEYKWETISENASNQFFAFADKNDIGVDEANFKPLDVEYYKNVMAGYADYLYVFPAELYKSIPESIGWIFEGWQEES